MHWDQPMLCVYVCVCVCQTLVCVYANHDIAFCVKLVIGEKIPCSWAPHRSCIPLQALHSVLTRDKSLYTPSVGSAPCPIQYL